VENIHDNVKYQLGKISRIRKHKQHLSIRDVVVERMNEKKLYISAYINQLLAAKKSSAMRIPHSKEVARLKSG